MSQCEMIASLKGIGRQIRLLWPDDITTVEIDYLVEAVSLQMSTYRRIAQLRESGVKKVGDLEWNSWFPEGHPMRIVLADESEGLKQ